MGNSAGAGAILNAEKLRKYYHLEKHEVRVLEDVQFTITAGQWVALTGPSGCGKTTILYLLGGLDSPTAGAVCYRGTPYSQMSRAELSTLRRLHIGFVFQSYCLFPELNAIENVMLPGLQWGVNRRAVRDEAGSLLTIFGLGQRLSHRPMELSGGEQQRVAIARAMINNPEIILADEPTGNLDQTAGGEIMDIFSRLHVQYGKTIVMVTHDLKLAALADRVLSLANGRVVTNQPG